MYGGSPDVACLSSFRLSGRGAPTTSVGKNESRTVWIFTGTYGRARVDEYLELTKTDSSYYGTIIEEWEEYNFIHSDFDDVDYETNRTLLPMWYSLKRSKRCSMKLLRLFLNRNTNLTRTTPSRQLSAISTLLLEQVFQAADVSHTIQHLSVFLKWNKRLFEKMTQAYKDGRFPKDPRETWYNGELGFFDNYDCYIITMVERLCEAGMLGIDSVENCKSNRSVWETKGKDLIECQCNDSD